MQVVLILGGGIGKRFGTVLPKQYNLIDGKPVIDYVIEAALQARQTDRIVVVCDPQYSNHSRYMNQGQVEIVPSGAERYDSLQNGLNYIERHYDCQKLCILDAVAPFVYPELIDDYFERLDAADAVITCQKITGSLGNYTFDPLDREDYYITQSPEPPSGLEQPVYTRSNLFQSDAYEPQKEKSRLLSSVLRRHARLLVLVPTP